MYGRDLARVTALLLALCPAVVEARAARPDPLAHQAGCERYRGSPQEANDPSQLLELRLCTASDGSVRGTLQTSSLVSGWSARASAGSWQGDALILRETEFLQYKPEPDWRFCLIDEMKLERAENGALQGTYVSAACQDHASFVLERVVEAETAAADEATPPRPPVGTPVAVEPPTPPASEASSDVTPERARGCGCTSAGEPDRDGTGVLPLLAIGLLPLLSARRRQPPRVKPDRHR